MRSTEPIAGWLEFAMNLQRVLLRGGRKQAESKVTSLNEEP